MFGKKGSKILKLPPVRNWFTLTMTNKLVVIINSLKVPKIKKIFTIWNEIFCTKLQLPPEPLTRGLPSPPPDPLSVCPVSSTEFFEPPSTHEQNSWVRHWPRGSKWRRVVSLRREKELPATRWVSCSAGLDGLGRGWVFKLIRHCVLFIVQKEYCLIFWHTQHNWCLEWICCLFTVRWDLIY